MSRGIKQQDGEHLVVDDAGDEVGNALQQLIEVEDGGNFAADLGQQGKLTRLAGDLGVEPGVLYADGNARSEQCEQVLVLFGEGAGLGGFDIEDADHLVFRDQRHGEFGADAGYGVDEVLLRRYVVDQHGFATKDGLSGNALTDLDANALGDLGRMPDLEADAQFLGLFVEQQDGEDLVVEKALQHLGDALEKRVQVQRGVHRVGNLQ